MRGGGLGAQCDVWVDGQANEWVIVCVVRLCV